MGTESSRSPVRRALSLQQKRNDCSSGTIVTVDRSANTSRNSDAEKHARAAEPRKQNSAAAKRAIGSVESKAKMRSHSKSTCG